MTVVDVAIVGAGPAGLAAAIEARMSQLEVILIEQHSGPLDKACGEGLMPGALPLLERLGVNPVGMDLRGVTYLQGAASVTHRFAHAAGRGVRRTTLHAALDARATELGVTRITGKVRTVEEVGDEVQIRLGDPSAGVIRARYVLGCDGLHSTVARLTGLAVPAKGHHRRFGVRQHYAIAPWTDNIEVYYGPVAEFYVTPVSEHTVGIAMLAAQGTDFATELERMPALAERLAGVDTASMRRGAGPFKQRTTARHSGRILLVGDAAGYVDAITGEGLRLGFAQAREAVRCIVAGHPAEYERAWRRVTRSFRVLTSGLVVLATSPARRAIVPLAVRFPRLFGVIVERLAL